MKKALIISYSQTGQTEMALAGLTRGLTQNLECEFRRLRPQEDFPFPWKMRAFFRAFPRCVGGPAPAVEPLNILWEDYDLVILAYQVWFLSPSLPVQGFLNSPEAQGLRGKKVVTLVTCRNLWQSAQARVQTRLHEVGAHFLGQITLGETAPAWATFVTTPRWLLTGKKNAFWFFPEAGISSAVFKTLEAKGALLGRSWRDSQGAFVAKTVFGSNLNSVALAQMDAIGFAFFKLWSALIRTLAKRPGLWQDFLLLLFRGNLVLVILLTLPLTKLFEILVRNHPRFTRPGTVPA
jgi:hypothetical protein